MLAQGKVRTPVETRRRKKNKKKRIVGDLSLTHARTEGAQLADDCEFSYGACDL